MTALCVDDEPLLLNALVKAVSSSPDITSVEQFTLCSKALEWAENNRPDIAFLDIRMRGMDGFELANKLRQLYPDLPVVFCTGYREYAFDALQMHVSGYVMKPVEPKAILREIEYIKKKGAVPEKLKVQCFGNFEVFYNGKPLEYKRKRSKELFAFLIDRKGSSVTAREICTALWEDDSRLEKNTMHLYKLFADLRDTLNEIGMEEVLVKGNQNYSVNTEMLDCDYYNYLVGNTRNENRYIGEYMVQYSWAEETAALLDESLY